MSREHEPEFSVVRNLLWPVHRSEFRKFLPLAITILVITFNFSILKTIKDTIIITAAGSEAIPFLKLWVMLPAAFLVSILLGWCSTRFSRKKTFISAQLFFIGFFLFFSTVLFPMREWIHPHAWVASWREVLPQGLGGMLSLVEYWSYTLFYLFAELFGVVILSVMFWGFVNQVTQLQQAKRFYGLLNLVGNLPCVLAPLALNFMIDWILKNQQASQEDRWESVVSSSGILVASLGLVGVVSYWFAEKYAEQEAALETSSSSSKKSLKSKKPKASLVEGFRLLASDSYVRNIGILVLAYNIVINLLEVVWKEQVSQLYPDKLEFSMYMNQVMTATGFVGIFCAMFLGTGLVRRFGWAMTAFATPFVIVLTGVPFLGCVVFTEEMSGVADYFGMTSLSLAVMMGAGLSVVSKAVKYSLFDTSKELAFIPMDEQTRGYSKAAIDGVCSRIGKSGGSAILQICFFVFGGIGASTPAVLIAVLVLLVGWGKSILDLGAQFDERCDLSNHDQSGPSGSQNPPAQKPTRVIETTKNHVNRSAGAVCAGPQIAATI
ncbi:MAG: Npt1/Npt2 family nucleotide transporter [Oligoflexales bacterium]